MTMRFHKAETFIMSWPVVVAALLLLAYSGGCQQVTDRPPLQTADELGQGFNRTAEALNAQRAAKKINDDAWPWIVRGMTIASDLLAQAEDAALSGDKPTFRAVLVRFFAAYEDRMLRPKAQVERGLPVTMRPAE